MNSLRSKLESGKVALGTHVSLNNPVITEMMGECGFDYIWIDTEHTTVTLEQLQMHLIAAKAAKVAGVARIPWNDPIRLKPVLEMGPDGVVIPMIRNYEEAEKAIQSFFYPPRGVRGFGPQRAIQFGKMEIDEYFKNYSDIVRILQVEHIDAINDLDRILTIPEIDVMLFGPCDLASSMGKLGAWFDPEVQDVIDKASKKIKDAGKKLGVSYGPCTEDTLRRWHDRGVDMISIAADTNFIIQGAQNTLNMLKHVF